MNFGNGGSSVVTGGNNNFGNLGNLDNDGGLSGLSNSNMGSSNLLLGSSMYIDTD